MKYLNKNTHPSQGLDSNSHEGGGITVPKHYYVDHAPYFITVAIDHHQKLLFSAAKDKLHDLLLEVFTEYGWSLDYWVILDNHYHVLGNSRIGRDLPKILNKVHNQSAQFINQHLPSRDTRQVWRNYWDYCPRNEYDYNVRLCYLLNNPVKHGYVGNLYDWEWSSFAQTYARLGDEKMRGLFQAHQDYRKLVLPEDDF